MIDNDLFYTCMLKQRHMDISWALKKARATNMDRRHLQPFMTELLKIERQQINFKNRGKENGIKTA